MNKICMVVLITPLAGCGTLSNNTHWRYGDGLEGPAHWGELSEEYVACSNGKNQSPVNIVNPIEAKLDTLTFNYRSDISNIVHNGHTIRLDVAPGSLFSDGADTFELKQFHFHSPSEHLMTGQPFPMEAHFVHADEQRNLAVVAVIFEEGEENPGIKKLWPYLPRRAGQSYRLAESAHHYLRLLPQKMDFFRYNGSLTTPPCSEGVRWFIFKQPVTVSKQQIEIFKQTLGHPNNRPVQKIFAREILE